MFPISSLRLANQHLSLNNCTTAGEIVSRLGAIQAQDVNMSKWAIGVRLPACTESLVNAACDKGEILRTHVLRPTWHLVSPTDIRWMLELTRERIKAQFKARDRELELDDAQYTKSNKIIVKVLADGRHLTREEIATALEKEKIGTGGGRIYHIMMNAELDGLVCSGAMKGKKQTYALLDLRAPKATLLPKEEALARLALRYFTGHGPATLPDFAWWSGLSAAAARQALELVKTQLISENFEGQEYWFPSGIPAAPAQPARSFLLPAWDEYLVGYRDRSAVLQAEHLRRTISSNGIFRPVVIHKGLVTGIWSRPAGIKKTVEIDWFKKLDNKSIKLITESITNFNNFYHK